MSEVNETNDMLTEIKEQLIIATHETGEMPNIMKSKKKADSNRGYFYDAQNNTLYLKDEQTWNAIQGNLSADLSSDDMGMNVSIQPLQGIDGYQGESIEDLQDKVDKVNQDSQYEYYRLIKRHGSDYLLCYSFNNTEDRDRFAAEMDDALVVGNSDVGDGAKYDYDDEEIDENFSDEKVLDAPSRRKQNDNRKQKDTQKEKAKVNKKKQKDDEKKKNDDDKKNDDNKKKKNDDGNTKDNEEEEHEVTLVEELGDTLVNQTGGTQVNDNSASGNAAGAGKPVQSIEARFAAVNNGQPLPNRYAYLEQYCRIAKEFGEPDGYSLSKDMGKRTAFCVDKGLGKPTGTVKDLRDMCRENLLMHMLADILPAIAGGKVKHCSRREANRDMNTFYFEGTGVPVNLDLVLNNENLRNSVFYGYFRRLLDSLKPLASQNTFDRYLTAGIVINCVINDIGLMREFLGGETWGKWKLSNGESLRYGECQDPNGSRSCSEVILPYGWMCGADFSLKRDDKARLVWRLTPRTVGFKVDANNYAKHKDFEKLDGGQVVRAASVAFDCGDVFPSGDLKKDVYYLCWAQAMYGLQPGGIVSVHGNEDYKTYYEHGVVSKSRHMAALKQERLNKRGMGDFMTTYFSPALKVSNLNKLLTPAEVAELEVPQEVLGDGESMFTPPIISNYDRELQNLNSVQGGPCMQPF
ncbi:MAG: hypothetical protein IJT14_00285 [Rickettsiales bacterium]|nr:hypothetical protein [Rickettsiales bacterium]